MNVPVPYPYALGKKETFSAECKEWDEIQVRLE